MPTSRWTSQPRSLNADLRTNTRNNGPGPGPSNAESAYELDFPPNFYTHPVISVAHLRPFRSGDNPFGRTVPPPPPVEADQHSDDGDVYAVEAWKGWGHEHNSWHSEDHLRHSAELITAHRERHEQGPPGASPDVRPALSYLGEVSGTAKGRKGDNPQTHYGTAPGNTTNWGEGEITRSRDVDGSGIVC
ncbi:hypothetical protein F5Y17DRAFT_463769 [Xylariaceae sp. FL0594]|nr:hypothetical protein F5Y17DRAFT_463769 [Xylariaceae sp. FL0594]